MFSVYLYDYYIGTIERSRGRIRFTYARAAIENDAIPALSISLPKRPESYSDRQAGPFFRNLLPEQAYRRLVSSAAGTDVGDGVALLGAIGGECPGAVSIWPGDTIPPAVDEYQALSDSDLAELFSASGRPGLGSAITRGRLSLPGVQEKIALLKRPDDRWALPLNGAVTSHILKQHTGDFSELLENELFCMALAEKVGLPVPDSGIPAPNVRVFCAKRFDRVVSNAYNGVPGRRIHQEDFCQVLRVPPEKKYERDGGPGIRKCAKIIRDYSALPASDLPGLVQWVGFNCLIGNEDAHAKNLAFLYIEQGLRIAPYYDLVSTEVYQHLERSLAMKVGASWDVRNLQKSDWRRFAGWTELSWDRVRALLLEVSALVAAAVDEVKDSCSSHYGHARIYSDIAAVVAHHTNQMDRELTGA